MSDSITAFESKDKFKYSTRLGFATMDAEEMCRSSGGNTSCCCCAKGWIWCGILFEKTCRINRRENRVDAPHC